MIALIVKGSTRVRHVGGGTSLGDRNEFPCDDEYADKDGNRYHFHTTSDWHLLVLREIELEELFASPATRFARFDGACVPVRMERLESLLSDDNDEEQWDPMSVPEDRLGGEE